PAACSCSPARASCRAKISPCDPATSSASTSTDSPWRTPCHEYLPRPATDPARRRLAPVALLRQLPRLESHHRRGHRRPPLPGLGLGGYRGHARGGQGGG